MSNQQLKFDTKAFLAAYWPCPTSLHVWLAHYQISVEKAALFKQFARGSIPAGQFAIMLALLELEHGHPISLAPYLK